MSRPSFPRPEHLVLLREKIGQWLLERNLEIEVAERGLDHYRCQYRFGFRRPPGEWLELPVHFQVADRLEMGHDEGELHRLLKAFLGKFFEEKKKD
ncbi:MAG: hypothetical protein HY313_01745 [Acidobacteria bacterium]|nr:hypothetical protein [Acidobacteriota bacterium]